MSKGYEFIDVVWRCKKKSGKAGLYEKMEFWIDFRCIMVRCEKMG